MLKIGLTGGIGSGKTTVAKVFETLGIPVYYADDATKRLMNTNKSIKDSLIKHFGKSTYTEEILNRKYLANIVFGDKEKLALLNSITHPITIKDAEEWMSKQRSAYVIKEAALLFETDAANHLDYFIGVSAPIDLRIKRVINRDHVTEEEVMKRISKKMNEEEKMNRCDFIIMNNDEELVIPQIIKLHEKIMELVKK